jgi:hypothetical protein
LEPSLDLAAHFSLGGAVISSRLRARS